MMSFNLFINYIILYKKQLLIIDIFQFIFNKKNYYLQNFILCDGLIITYLYLNVYFNRPVWYTFLKI